MGVVHDQTLNVGGIAASILGRLVSKGGKHEPNEEVEVNLQTLLQHSICRKGKFHATTITSSYPNQVSKERNPYLALALNMMI